MAYQLEKINSAIRSDAKGFLEACDAAFSQKVAAAAAAIAENMNKSRIVLLSGPSGSGKTTTAMKIEEVLRGMGVESRSISMDNYFRSIDPHTAPRTEDGEIDYESPLCLDMELLNTHFEKLEAGEAIRIPKFEFARQMRNDSMSAPLRLGSNEIAIFEGIHALGDEIAGRHPNAQKLYISARSNVNDGTRLVFKGTWMRLVRRAVRDYSFRGSDVSFTLSLWANVRRGEKLYISPFKERANIIFDSSLPYEVSVMKNYALPLLQAVPKENARRTELLELVKAFENFEPVDPALVPADSLLREFIGGGSYEYK